MKEKTTDQLIETLRGVPDYLITDCYLPIKAVII